MKRNFKILFIILIEMLMFNAKVFASTSFSVSKSSVAVGDSFKVSVSANSVAAWNVHTSVEGPVSGCIINEADATADAKDTNKTFTADCKSTGVGTISITLTGDVTTASGESSDLSGTKTVSVRQISTNNNLSSIKIDNKEISEFSSSKTTYNIESESPSINISVTKEDSTAKVTGDGKKTLSYGNNKFEIKVTAENGSVKTYTLNITRKDNRDTNNYLSDLTVGGKSITLNKNTTSYTVNVENDIEKTTIAAMAESTKAKVTGAGEKTLKYGNNKFEIKVTAENESVKKYTVTVVRKDDRDSNNNLSSLTIDSGSLSFNKNTTTYNVKVENDIEKITISAEAESEKAKVTGAGEKTLKVGSNKFVIKVTAENESVKNYTINITRQSDDEEETVVKEEKYVKSLEITGIDLSFDPDKTSYNISIKDEDSLDFDYELEDGVTAKIEGNENLKNGSVVTLKLTKGSETKEYKFNISKDEKAVVEPIPTTGDDPKAEEPKKDNWIIYVIIGVIALVIIGIISKLISSSKEKKTQAAMYNEAPSMVADESQAQMNQVNTVEPTANTTQVNPNPNVVQTNQVNTMESTTNPYANVNQTNPTQTNNNQPPFDYFGN